MLSLTWLKGMLIRELHPYPAASPGHRPRQSVRPVAIGHLGTASMIGIAAKATRLGGLALPSQFSQLSHASGRPAR